MLLFPSVYSNKMFSLNPLINMSTALRLRSLPTFKTFLHVYNVALARPRLHDVRPCMCLPICSVCDKASVCVGVQEHEHTCKLVCVDIDRFVEGSVQVAVLT